MDLIVTHVEKLAEKFLKSGRRLAVVESCTGGWIAQACVSLAGSSLWFECGWVTYSSASKTRLVNVPVHLIQSAGVVSSAVACAMAEGGLRQSDATDVIAVTGVAGPSGGSLQTPVGTVWIAWASIDQSTRSSVYLFPGDRTEVRHQAVLKALIGAYSG